MVFSCVWNIVAPLDGIVTAVEVLEAAQLGADRTSMAGAPPSRRAHTTASGCSAGAHRWDVSENRHGRIGIHPVQFAIEPRTNPHACTYDTARYCASGFPTCWVGEALP